MRRRPTTKSESELAMYAETGRFIRKAREAQHMTQARLAAAVGMSRTSIANIERGYQRLLLHTLSSLADVLDLPIAQLLPKRNRTRLSLEHKLPKDISPKEREWITRIVQRSAKAR